MTYLLDANILMDFQSSGLLAELVKASHVVEFAVVEEVFDEFTLEKPDDSGNVVGKKRRAASSLELARIKKIAIMPGTPEKTLMVTLSGKRTKDKGEAASIAIAVGDRSLIFVTGDKNATIWALNELFHSGERVMRVPVFIRTLFELNALGPSSVKRIAEGVEKNRGPIPSWWTAWLASMPTERAQAARDCDKPRDG